MTKSSRKRGKILWFALAVAVTLGAGMSFAYVGYQKVNASRGIPGASLDQLQVESAVESVDPYAYVPPPDGADAPDPSPVSPGMWPFNAKLTSQNIPVKGGGVRSGGCSGALIHPSWVITAGHCFHDINNTRVSGRPPYDMTVTIGKTKDSDPGGHTVHVVEVRQSPMNDLAVVKLDRPITDIAPMTFSDEPPPVGQRLEFAGWGSTSADVVKPSDHLKHGQFTISDIKSTTYHALPVVPRTPENSPCRDDSGAPFFTSDDGIHGHLVATEVEGPSCPQPGTEVLARVDVVADWITDQIED